MSTTFAPIASIDFTPAAVNDDLDVICEITCDHEGGSEWEHLDLMLGEQLDEARVAMRQLNEAAANLRGVIGARFIARLVDEIRVAAETARFYRTMLGDLVLHEGDEAYLEELDARTFEELGIRLVLDVAEDAPTASDLPAAW